MNLLSTLNPAMPGLRNDLYAASRSDDERKKVATQ
jgi:hypothetical protein